MRHPGFFERRGPYLLSSLAERVGATLIGCVDRAMLIGDVKTLRDAGPTDLSFFDPPQDLADLVGTRAGACLVSEDNAKRLPTSTVRLVTDTPSQAFATAVQLLYTDPLPSKAAVSVADASGELIHATAELEEGATIEPGAVVGRQARIGRRTTVAAGAVVGYRVVIGCDGYVGPGATVTHALIGDRVILHAGSRVGQDGFCFAMASAGHCKLPQIGRVIIGDDVEIGANATIDRGSLHDTMIGSGTKIDNLVQIGHNAIIGRHCVIVAQSSIAAAAELGDLVVMGAHSNVVGHVKIGSEARIAGMALVKEDVLPGTRVGGIPARPFNEWAREITTLKRLSLKEGEPSHD